MCNDFEYSFHFQGVQHLGPATDFYKKLALDCSGQQIGVDLFLLSSQYADLASLCKNNTQHFHSGLTSCVSLPPRIAQKPKYRN